MTIFSKANPLLPVTSIPLSMAFYDKLGFQRMWEDIDYGILRRDEVEIHLWKCADPRIPENTSCRIHVTGLEELFEVYTMLNVVAPNFPIAEEPWGGRAFGVFDLDGNLIKFTEANEDKHTAAPADNNQRRKKQNK